jgi:hypothetical protein
LQVLNNSNIIAEGRMRASHAPGPATASERIHDNKENDGNTNNVVLAKSAAEDANEDEGRQCLVP